jgi:hypothetical protein
MEKIFQQSFNKAIETIVKINIDDFIELDYNIFKPKLI